MAGLYVSRLMVSQGLAAAMVFAAAFAYVPSAFACACCSFAGSRYVKTERISALRLGEVDQMDFAGTAKLALSEDDIAIKGIDKPAVDYRLEVTRFKDDSILFTFRDDKDRAGTLRLNKPSTISIFEVDPLSGAKTDAADKDAGLGPDLYKEWKLTANAVGDGMFRAAAGAGQKLTLVLQGHGPGCTSADHFTGWTLLVYGPAGSFSLYGAMEPKAR